jgi:hypothetical protein
VDIVRLFFEVIPTVGTTCTAIHILTLGAHLIPMPSISKLILEVDRTFCNTNPCFSYSHTVAFTISLLYRHLLLKRIYATQSELFVKLLLYRQQIGKPIYISFEQLYRYSHQEFELLSCPEHRRFPVHSPGTLRRRRFLQLNKFRLSPAVSKLVTPAVLASRRCDAQADCNPSRMNTFVLSSMIVMTQCRNYH